MALPWSFTRGEIIVNTVTDLVLDMHADEQRGISDILRKYVGLVEKAADGKLTAEDKAAAAGYVFELKFPPDRFDRDVGTWRVVRSLDAEIAADEKTKPSAEDNLAAKEKLRELEAAVVEHRLQMQRAVSLAHGRVHKQTHRNSIAKENPHLFSATGVLSANEWANARN